MPALFTPRFVAMFAHSFLVFASMFQLFPVAPYRVMALGGSMLTGGLFLGILTYASAISAPFTGPLCDRVGHRRALLLTSLLLAALTFTYAFIDSYSWLLTAVVVHGVIWSGLMSASGAYTAGTIPPARRAEGLGYWGLASIAAIGVAPALGFLVYEYGWRALCFEIAGLNIAMAAIAWRLPDERVAPGGPAGTPARGQRLGVEWRVLILSISMALIAFGYGGLTSFTALFADALGVTPRGIFLTAMAVTVIAGRVALGRRLDRIGADRVLLPCLALAAAGLFVLAFATGTPTMLAAGLVFGVGFGLMYPSYAAFVVHHIPQPRRGAAFGAMLAAFDTGIGTGSAVTGWLVRSYGFRTAFLAAAVVASIALPYFVFVRRRLHFDDAR